ncbi:MAG: hypothetical protein ACRC67_09305 [Inquilinus sp.]|uniref:hypothetical protein n=1 Tax=Inquilinus sp. TaxID=1932117 RepID=UPI003F363DFD
MRHARWPNAAIAALLLAACAQKPVPQRSLDDALAEAMMKSMASTFICMTQRPKPMDAAVPLFPLDCSVHMERALDILAVRCPGLPAAEGLPQAHTTARRQAEDPPPDELLVHLCAVLPWQDRSALARLL